MTRFALRTFACLVSGLTFLFSGARVQAISSTEADASFDSFNTSFYVVNNGRGYYRTDTAGGRADFWKYAEMIEIIIDAYERTGRASYKAMIAESLDGFLYYNGSDWRWNMYNDDLMWMVIACCRGYAATGNTTYRDRAKFHFDAVYDRGWDAALGGGIWWTTEKDGKNACINGPAAIAACLLYEVYGDTNYLQKAQAIYAWERSKLFELATGKVYDNINASGVVNSNWIFTYNQGTFIGAAHQLHRLTGNPVYYSDALKAALHCRDGMSTAGILPEYGDDGDGGGFTGILARWLGRFVKDYNLHSTFYVWMAQNANASWTVRRADNLSWCKWRSQTPEGTLTSFGCSSSVAWMQAVPTDYGLPALLYQPVALTPSSYNRDIVVEKTAPPTPAPGAYTTASMDSGTANRDKSWYEVGYNTAAPSTGVPAAGSIFTYADRQYRMAPSYAANNAFLLNSTVTTATLSLSAPAAFGRLSFLVTGGGGSGTISATISHEDGSTQVATLAVPDWFSGLTPAYTARGRIDVRTFAFDNVNTANPRFFPADVTLADTSSPVTRVTLAYGSGANNYVLALSGSTGGNFVPILITGYTQDIIVEAVAAKFGPLPGVTTATMEGGVANNNNTWFETGYLATAPRAGLPPAGGTVTNFVNMDRRFTTAPSYTGNNVIFFTPGLGTVSVFPAAPARLSRLTFLTASGQGPVTIGCLIRHADGTAQTVSFVAPHWLDQSPMALVPNGRINVTTGSAGYILQNNPRLYAPDVGVANTASPVTNLVFTFNSGGANATAAIFAISGIPGTVAPVLVAHPQSQKVWENAPLQLNASALGAPSPGLQWQKKIEGVFANLTNGPGLYGVTSPALVFNPVDQADEGEFRLVASNSSGAVTSSVATLTVMSALPDLTRSGSPVSSFGGNSPAQETVTNAIDNTTSKYLNFGLNNGSGTFVGPVGLVVTLESSDALVKGLRFYTANDEPGRDPAAYALYGSNDGGTTYLLIAASGLNLPAGRNAGGAALDPITQNAQQVLLANSRTFSRYKLNISSIKTPSAAMTQIGEVEFLGVVIPRLTLAPGTETGRLILQTSAPGRLWSTSAFNGPETVWLDEGPISGGLEITPAPGTPAKFYRVSAE